MKNLFNNGLGTPLHSAAETESLDMVEMLLLKGTDPLIKDSMGYLAFELAEYHGHEAVAARLRPLTVLPAKPLDKLTESASVNKYN